MELASQHRDVLYLTADSGEGGLDLMFRRNMVAAAAGLAASGKIPFVYTAAPFLAYRAFEFIRNDVCLQNLPVKLIGTGSGISVSSLGPTHHATEDIAVLRSLPNLRILSPATPRQAYACVQAAYECSGPVYIRLGMNREREYFPDGYRLPDEGCEVLRLGSDVTLFTTGGILEEAMAAAERLEARDISVCVVNVPVLKPFDAPGAIRLSTGARLICSVEEHNVIGGLGSAISDALVDAGVAVRLVRIGLPDRFSVGYGTLPQLRRENGLDAETIAARIEEALQ